MRNKPWAMDYLTENSHIVDVDGTYKQNIRQFFNNDNDIHIEVGTGMGQFITTLAKRNPNINFVGIEVDKNVLIRVLEKIVEEKLTNVRLLLFDANHLNEYFNESEISKVYLNFSDPWPKNRHEKRRLTYESFLKQYKYILKIDGILEFKTDNRGLFEYSLLSLNNFGTKFLEVILDLHSEETEDNIRTEYEEKFSQKGFNIHKIVVQF